MPTTWKPFLHAEVAQEAMAARAVEHEGEPARALLVAGHGFDQGYEGNNELPFEYVVFDIP